MDDVTTYRAAVGYLVGGGWQIFVYHSTYCGSHEGSDWAREYLFHPEVDISRWRGIEFGHGSYRRRGPDSIEFAEWIDKLNPSQYLVTGSYDLDDYGYWPEGVYGLLGDHWPIRLIG